MRREKPSIPKSSKKILAESSNGQRRRPSGDFLSRSDQLLKEKRQREHEVRELELCSAHSPVRGLQDLKAQLC
eukprot:COSAG02_NODE_2132_length_9721_cov_44.831324_6_plen_73_part_00